MLPDGDSLSGNLGRAKQAALPAGGQKGCRGRTLPTALSALRVVLCSLMLL